jgi:hypothetical protein
LNPELITVKIELMTTRSLRNEGQNCNIEPAFSQDLCTKVKNFHYEEKGKEFCKSSV